MDFEVPADIADLLRRIDEFIEAEIKPLKEQDDNARFFDHRREFARTDVERGGVPTAEWYALLGEMRRRADAAGFYRWALPEELGGRRARTWAWRSSGSTWRPRASACTTTSRTSPRSWATIPSC